MILTIRLLRENVYFLTLNPLIFAQAHFLFLKLSYLFFFGLFVKKKLSSPILFVLIFFFFKHLISSIFSTIYEKSCEFKTTNVVYIIFLKRSIFKNFWVSFTLLFFLLHDMLGIPTQYVRFTDLISAFHKVVQQCLQT